MAAAVLAAWFGGLIGGMTAIIVAVVLNAVVFLGSDDIGQRDSSSSARSVFVVAAPGPVRPGGLAAGLATAWSMRSTRCRTLAEEVETRDARLELMLAASGTGFWEWDVITGGLTWSDAIFRQHGLDPVPGAPAFAAYLDDDPPRRP